MTGPVTVEERAAARPAQPWRADSDDTPTSPSSKPPNPWLGIHGPHPVGEPEVREPVRWSHEVSHPGPTAELHVELPR